MPGHPAFIMAHILMICLISVLTVSHRGNALQSRDIGNNASEYSDVTADCPLLNNVSFSHPVSSWRWDNRSTVRGPPIGYSLLLQPLSIHRDTWVVCGLPEPTSTSSTRALCATGVAPSTLSILLWSGLHILLLSHPRLGEQGDRKSVV